METHNSIKGLFSKMMYDRPLTSIISAATVLYTGYRGYVFSRRHYIPYSTSQLKWRDKILGIETLTVPSAVKRIWLISLLTSYVVDRTSKK